MNQQVGPTRNKQGIPNKTISPREHKVDEETRLQPEKCGTNSWGGVVLMLARPVDSPFGTSRCACNHWLPESIIKTPLVFFSSKRSKTHPSERESSHQPPQLFNFHNTAPQKRAAFPFIQRCQPKEDTELLPIQLFSHFFFPILGGVLVVRGCSFNTARHCQRLKRPEDESDAEP